MSASRPRLLDLEEIKKLFAALSNTSDKGPSFSQALTVGLLSNYMEQALLPGSNFDPANEGLLITLLSLAPYSKFYVHTPELDSLLDSMIDTITYSTTYYYLSYDPNPNIYAAFNEQIKAMKATHDSWGEVEGNTEEAFSILKAYTKYCVGIMPDLGRAGYTDMNFKRLLVRFDELAKSEKGSKVPAILQKFEAVKHLYEGFREFDSISKFIDEINQDRHYNEATYSGWLAAEARSLALVNSHKDQKPFQKKYKYIKNVREDFEKDFKQKRVSLIEEYTKLIDGYKQKFIERYEKDHSAASKSWTWSQYYPPDFLTHLDFFMLNFKSNLAKGYDNHYLKFLEDSIRERLHDSDQSDPYVIILNYLFTDIQVLRFAQSEILRAEIAAPAASSVSEKGINSASAAQPEVPMDVDAEAKVEPTRKRKPKEDELDESKVKKGRGEVSAAGMYSPSKKKGEEVGVKLEKKLKP